jgi:hypothetical protein
MCFPRILLQPANKFHCQDNRRTTNVTEALAETEKTAHKHKMKPGSQAKFICNLRKCPRRVPATWAGRLTAPEKPMIHQKHGAPPPANPAHDSNGHQE